MAKGKTESFGHQLFGLFQLSTKAMNNPWLWLSSFHSTFFLQFMTKRQQLIESFDTMDNDRFAYRLRHCDLSTKSCDLDCQLYSTHFIQPALSNSPYVCAFCMALNPIY
jgi:hypothetical protein